MKKLKNRVLDLYYKLRYFKKHRKFAGYEKTLQSALLQQEKEKLNREVEQLVLKKRIVRHMARYMNVKGNSRFIPRTIKNDEVYRREIHRIFGEDMIKWGVKLKHDLTLCIIP